MSTTKKNKNLTRLIDASRVIRRKPAKAKPASPTNHVILVLDQSGSMNSIREDAAKAFKQQVESIRTEARKARQKVDVHTITFSDKVNPPQRDFDVDAYSPGGQTALWSAISKAITFGDDRREKNDTLLIVVVTDGQENASVIKDNPYIRMTREFIRRQIGTAIADENVSIVANVPPGGSNLLADIGIPVFNIREWEATSQGVVHLTARSASGYGGYFGARASGQSGRGSTMSLMANMDAVTPNDVNRMDDVSNQFKRWRVENQHDGEQIADFVQSRGVLYVVGSAFYELTKSEKVSANKRLLILDKQTGAVYAGDQARRKLGVPLNQDVRLKPGNQGEFTLFVESTSYNRKLVGGTTLLYRV